MQSVGGTYTGQNPRGVQSQPVSTTGGSGGASTLSGGGGYRRRRRRWRRRRWYLLGRCSKRAFKRAFQWGRRRGR